MGAPGAAAEADVLLAALLEPARISSTVAGGPRRVLQLGRLQAELGRGGGKGPGQLGDRLGPRLDQRRGRLRQPRVPDPRSAGDSIAGRQPREQRVALRHRLAEALAQLSPRRPAGGEEAVEVGSALGRRALDQRQPVGREDRDRWAVAGDRRRVGRVAVEQVAAPFAAADRGEQLALEPVLVADRRLGPRQRAAEGDQVAAVRGAKRAAGEGEVEGLDQVRLAGRRWGR